MQDLISRQAAIDAMTNILWHYPNECYRNLNEYEFAKGLAELGLKSVPSAQPDLDEWCTDRKRKKGKWINMEIAPFANNDGQLIYEKVCNQCGTIAYFRGVGNDCIGNNFCSYCGAKMVGEGEEE